MNVVIQKILILGFLSIMIVLTYLWISPLVDKVRERSKLEDAYKTLREIGEMIVYTAQTGTPMEKDIYIPGEIKIKNGYIELKIVGKIPMILSKEFIPLFSSEYPFYKEEKILESDENINCSQTNCTWCLEYGCDSNDVKVGNFSNYTFAIFWINDRYASICFTTDNLSDNYLEISENDCYFEGDKFGEYDISLIDELGDYAILEGREVIRPVTADKDRISVVGKSVGREMFTSILRLYILDVIGERNVTDSIIIICERNCWELEGYKKVTTELERIKKEGNTIKRFIKVSVS